MKKILIIAGEASSDMHAASLVRNIKALDKDAGFFGLGGDRMQDSGVRLLENIVRIAFIGPGGLFKHYFKLKKIYNSVCEHIDTERPDCAILIDYAEFNLLVAKKLKSAGIPVIYYISPQVWAWGRWRLKKIKRLIDKMLVLFKFEKEFYRDHGIEADFVGHPLLDIVKPSREKPEILKELRLSADTKVIGVLPGSRKSEIDNILPVMLDSCKIILKKIRPDAKIEFILPLAPTIEESRVKKIVDESSLKIRLVKNYTYDALSLCDCAMVASGTATLETALMGVPMAIIYKTNTLTYLMTRALIKLPYIGLVNVVAGKKIAAEFLQYGARPEDIANYILKLLTDKNLTQTIKKEFAYIKESLGEPGASVRAAAEVVRFLAAGGAKSRRLQEVET